MRIAFADPLLHPLWRVRIQASGTLLTGSRPRDRHSDIRMTLAIYTHATDDMQDAATAALEEAFS